MQELHIKSVYSRETLPAHTTLTSRLDDGLYQVVTNIFVAGFIVENHQVVSIAPILVKNFISRWQREAKRIGD